MSDQSPDRLKAFRAQYDAAPKGNHALAIANLVLLVAGFATLAVLLLREPAARPAVSEGTSGGLTLEQQREYAVRLANKKLAGPAIAAYEEYLKNAPLTLPERAKVCYSVAKLAIEDEKYETALPYLYQAEYLDPKSELKEEINKKVVLCLDKLGRNVDLRHELRKRSDVKHDASQVKADDVILAEFGNEAITKRDLEMEIEQLPPAAKDSFNAPEKKAELLKNLVAERLLLDKARRLELDKAPEVQDLLARQLDSMIVQKLIADEVRKDVQITPEDVERFYKAEPALFTEPAMAEVRVAKAGTEEAARAITEFIEKPVVVRKGGPMPGVKDLEKAPEELFSAEPGAVVGPVSAGGEWYVFKVESVTPEKILPYDEVKDRATRMYQMRKEQEKVSSIIEETLKAREVRLYLDRLQEGEKK
ncbi:MAG TPA: peptidyl-prolyl cis-trans isomerase [Candidatus Hydrogenedentes bacterium]|nr:peptidyl-prolyl cis-trans isomerase [Candidatus Hydrogenedentota bacterium]HOT49340.1 peptidyl-prolyl cis-trans isomerase [Candidatus Hydrogenedentota bacterium]HOV74056.1 peptidyl-prolyl cis-trans isomerase [Candidatus Hydrogenedentota bacterium]HPC15958.1 peptidyl-prolyl cis-trans isomerase [Candidatus Hydrogenedentota bacterium]HRT19912.1 peptidyl-prolyl cis-trans isomerase [Candidatus Hydrogenedentota bacterium]